MKSNRKIIGTLVAVIIVVGGIISYELITREQPKDLATIALQLEDLPSGFEVDNIDNTEFRFYPSAKMYKGIWDIHGFISEEFGSFEDWGFENAYMVQFTDNYSSKIYSLVARFSNFDGAKNNLKLANTINVGEDLSAKQILEIGDNCILYSSPSHPSAYIVTFRKANYFAEIVTSARENAPEPENVFSTDDVINYAQIVENRMN